MNLDQVEIFRPGRHVAMSGAVIDFSAADVAAIAASYDPAVHEAPHVIGHPKTDGPAYGWVQSLGVNEAGRLCITSSRQVEPAFAELVGAGRYKKRSASFYPPDHPSNPKPGSYYLKHVGWLGATPPSIKGLADFTAPEAGLVEFADWDDELNANLWRRLREWLIAKFGLEEADKVAPGYAVDELQRLAQQPDADETPAAPPSQPTPAFAEGEQAVKTLTPDLTARAAELDAREARLAEQEAAQAEAAKVQRSAGIAAFADTMVAEGRWLPGERKRWVEFMEAMPAEAVIVEFGEGDAKTETPALEVFQAAMKALPPRIEFAELVRNETKPAEVDMKDPAAITAAAVAFSETESKAGRTVSFEQAVQHVVTTHKQG